MKTNAKNIATSQMINSARWLPIAKSPERYRIERQRLDTEKTKTEKKRRLTNKRSGYIDSEKAL